MPKLGGEEGHQDNNFWSLHLSVQVYTPIHPQRPHTHTYKHHLHTYIHTHTASTIYTHKHLPHTYTQTSHACAHIHIHTSIQNTHTHTKASTRHTNTHTSIHHTQRHAPQTHTHLLIISLIILSIKHWCQEGRASIILPKLKNIEGGINELLSTCYSQETLEFS